ncbi:hypothetical protein PIB30_052104 [Stylosanthes scabra]|uniref:C2 NT-type domain-containing protein n=1 Tax=Stylosanthes scabra TaxID=79078 RepID=A0ABU6SJP8_9FABA|nr:hypothetical protein [Stylosanthes scabra]
MFRPARWWTDRNRVKALFKLHFHLTQVNESGVDALVLSIVPGDIGKPTTRLDQATVRDGVCTWHNPVYETVKFIQDPKTGKFTDKLYQFLLSTGSSKGSPIGEASINIADYAEATKPCYLSLPIRISHSDALLHVSIQRIQENCDQREEEQEECEDDKQKSHDWIISNHISNSDIDESTRSYSSEEVTAKAMNNREELDVNCSTSSESDTTLSSSDDSSGLDSPRELGLKRKKNIHSSKDVFLSGDSTNGSNRDIPKEDSLESHPIETEKLKAELAALARHVDVSDMELQTLRKQIVKETKRGQDLAKEILVLKEERDAFKFECESLRSFHKRMDEARLRSRSQLEARDLGAFMEEIRQELSYEKDMNANLRLQLKKMQESNAELVLAVQDLEEMLEQSQCNNKESKELVETEMEKYVKMQSNGNNKDTEALEKKIIDLYGEIEMYRRDKDDLEVQLEQIALDYEILKQENHSIVYKLEQSQVQEQLKMQYECSSPPKNDHDLEMHIENLEKQLKEQSEDFSNSLATIKELETHIRRLEEELDKKKQGFEADLEAVTRDKVEQEQRAIKAEEALRKTRMANAKTAERLQEEFRRLSSQMTSAFDANEKAAMKALKEASQLRAEKSFLEETLEKAKQDIQLLQSDYEVKLDELSNQMNSMTVQIQQMKLEIEEKTKQLEDQKKNGEQAGSDFSEEIQVLKAENEDLKGEISLMKKSMEESEEMLERGSAERNELVSTIALLRKEAEESVNELKLLKDENLEEARRFEKDLETIRAQYSELKGSVSEEAAEKEKLRKQVLQMKMEIKKKEDALSSMERRLKDSLKNKKSASAPQNSKDMASLRENVKMLEGLVKSKEKALESSSSSFLNKEKEFQTKIEELENKVEEFNQIIALQQVGQELSIISSEDVCDEKEMVSELKERNKSMESELKEMQERYLEMSLKFAEVEGERQQLVMTLRNLNLKAINKP